MDKSTLDLKVSTDSATAKSIASRKGIGKVIQIEICQRWLHQDVANTRIELVKVKGEANISYILTTQFDDGTLPNHLAHMFSQRSNARHPLNPQKANDECSTETSMPHRH